MLAGTSHCSSTTVALWVTRRKLRGSEGAVRKENSYHLFIILRTFPPIFKDLITFWKSLKLVTERPNEMRI